jgi:hypothetical protein
VRTAPDGGFPRCSCAGGRGNVLRERVAIAELDGDAVARVYPDAHRWPRVEAPPGAVSAAMQGHQSAGDPAAAASGDQRATGPVPAHERQLSAPAGQHLHDIAASKLRRRHGERDLSASRGRCTHRGFVATRRRGLPKAGRGPARGSHLPRGQLGCRCPEGGRAACAGDRHRPRARAAGVDCPGCRRPFRTAPVERSRAPPAGQSPPPTSTQTTGSGTVSYAVNPGVFCSEHWQYGYTSASTLMRCTTTATDSSFRWRSA